MADHDAPSRYREIMGTSRPLRDGTLLLTGVSSSTIVVADHIAAGLDVFILSLMRPEDTAIAQSSEQLLSHVTYLIPRHGFGPFVRASLSNIIHGAPTLQVAWVLQAATRRDRIAVFRETVASRQFRGRYDIVHCHF